MVNDYEQFRDLGDEAREKVRYVLLSHDNDGVTKFGAELLTQRPGWLGPDRPAEEEDSPGRSPRGIPASMRWRPVTTFFQHLLVDMKNAQIPGAYRAAPGRTTTVPTSRSSSATSSTSSAATSKLERVKAACEAREAFRETLFT